MDEHTPEQDAPGGQGHANILALVRLTFVWRSVVFLGTVAVCLSPAHVARARAASPGQGPALLEEARPSDPALLSLLAKLAPNEHFVAAAAVDIDRDGDLDIVATTSQDFQIWVNHGSGRFTREQPSSSAALTSAPAVLDDPQCQGAQALVPRTSDQVVVVARTVNLPHGPPSAAAGSSLVVPARRFAASSFGRAPPPESSRV